APSPGTTAFTQAETAVRRSLQKIEDSIDSARQKLAAPPTHDDAAVQPTPAAPAAPAPQPTAMPDTPAPADRQPPQTAAQLRILDLLEKGTLSVEEAAHLLQALH
ncbi:MAG: hypothetical protein KC425_06045, partial [Anaerolineales bacterium]|nr:hypothetical protein [Anaerolineales bacterium]